jgi:hypothetical protein
LYGLDGEGRHQEKGQLAAYSFFPLLPSPRFARSACVPSKPILMPTSASAFSCAIGRFLNS